MIKRILYYSLAGKYFHISKLVGAFVIFAALLMFFQSGAHMIDSWDNVKFVNNCLEVAEGDAVAFTTCQENAINALNIYVRPDQDALNSKQFAMALLPPIAWLLFWIIVLGLGLLFYRTGSFMIPIEERIAEAPGKIKAVGKKKRRAKRKKKK